MTTKLKTFSYTIRAFSSSRLFAFLEDLSFVIGVIDVSEANFLPQLLQVRLPFLTLLRFSRLCAVTTKEEFFFLSCTLFRELDSSACDE
jgi:hypothetical protein